MSKTSEFRQLQFPGKSLMKSLHLKIEETPGFDIRNEPIACELLFESERPIFEFDPVDNLTFD